MNIVIFGAGAVGLGVGSCLAQADTHLTFVARSATARELREHGLRRSGIFGTRQIDPSQFDVIEQIDERAASSIDYILVCTKSFDSPIAAKAIAASAACRNDSCKIVLFQNGWGNFEVFCRHFDPGRVFNARVITGFERLAPNHVEVTVHADAIKIGSLADVDPGEMDDLARRISEGGIPAEVTPTIQRDLWAKMLYNCCLNPLGAVLGVKYGRLGESESTRQIMDAIADEVFAVMRAAGFETHWSDAAGFLRDFYAQMLPATQAHSSSMLQDLIAGRRTEIDAMSGAVVKLGSQHGLATPYNQAMRDLIRFKDQFAE